MSFFIVKDKQTNAILREGSCLPEEVSLQARNENEIAEEVEALSPPAGPPTFE